MDTSSEDDILTPEAKQALLVEDDPPIRRMLEKSLQRRGYAVESFDNGDAAWASYQTHPRPLVILDWMLPGLDGIEICRRIREAPEGASCTILIETARSDPKDLQEALRAGADDYFMKPIQMRVFEVRLAVAENSMRQKLARARAEAKLRESEAMYRMLVHALPDMVYKLDEEGAFAFVSEAADQFGYNAEDLIGKHFNELLVPGEIDRLSRDAVLPRFRGRSTGVKGAPKLFDERRARPRKTAHLEVKLTAGSKAPEGVEEIVGEVNACGMYDTEDDSGAFLGSTGIIRDVTARKEMERALIVSERANAVGALAGGIAHQFNNLHAIIKGYLELTRDLDGLPDKAREYLDVAHESTLQGAAVTHSLLAFCGRKKQRHEKKPVRLQEAVESTVKIVLREFASEGIVIDTDLQEVPELLADAGQVSQVLMNLLINARHAMLETPEKRIVIRAGVRAERAFVAVADTGCGIPADALSRVFDPFFTTKGEYAEALSGQANVRGVGLGLSVANTIAREHGGELQVESAPGAGSTFTLWLPLRGRDAAGEAASETDLSAAEQRRLQGARVLILEDEAHLRDLYTTVLSAEGAAATATDDAAEALRLHGETPFDLFLVDLQMPKLPGGEFLRRLRTAQPGDHPAAIIVTGRLDPDDLAAAGEKAVFDTLAKPVDRVTLLRRISAALADR